MVVILERCDRTDTFNYCSPFTQQNQCTLANADVKGVLINMSNPIQCR